MLPRTRRQARAVNQAARQRLSFASEQRYVLRIAGEDYTPHLLEMAWSGEDAEGGSPAVVLEATLSARLRPEKHTLERCRVFCVVRGERLLLFSGRVADVREKGGRTEILATTAGHGAEDTPLGAGPSADLEYAGERPDAAMYEVGGILPYDGARLPRVGQPRLVRSGDDKFSWSTTVSEVWEAIREECGFYARDTALNVLSGGITGPPVAPSAREAEWVFEEGVDIKEGELEVEPAVERRYYEVIVFREVNGVETVAARAPVDNAGVPVPRTSRYVEELADDDTESAHEKARRLAASLAPGEVGLTFPVAYVPVGIDRGDAVRVIGREIRPARTVARRYSGHVTAFEYDAIGKVAKLSVRGRQVSETRTERRPPYRAGTTVSRAPWGLDHLGRLRFAGSVPWVRQNPDGTLTFEDPAPITQNPDGALVFSY